MCGKEAHRRFADDRFSTFVFFFLNSPTFFFPILTVRLLDRFAQLVSGFPFRFAPHDCRLSQRRVPPPLARKTTNTVSFAREGKEAPETDLVRSSLVVWHSERKHLCLAVRSTTSLFTMAKKRRGGDVLVWRATLRENLKRKHGRCGRDLFDLGRIQQSKNESQTAAPSVETLSSEQKKSVSFTIPARLLATCFHFNSTTRVSAVDCCTRKRQHETRFSLFFFLLW